MEVIIWIGLFLIISKFLLKAFAPYTNKALDEKIWTDIKNKIDSDTIATLYPQGTLTERLLSTLLADNQHPNDVTLAHDLIQEISSS